MTGPAGVAWPGAAREGQGLCPWTPPKAEAFGNHDFGTESRRVVSQALLEAGPGRLVLAFPAFRNPVGWHTLS